MAVLECQPLHNHRAAVRRGQYADRVAAIECHSFTAIEARPISGTADFSGITTDEPLHISDVVHKAMLGVDENGVEAAAATAVVLAGSGMPPERVDFDVDRPFFIGLVDGPTNTLLFAGHIVDPTN